VDEAAMMRLGLTADLAADFDTAVQGRWLTPLLVIRNGVDSDALGVEQKISLSIRALTDREQRQALKKLASQQSESQTTTFGDLLASKLAQKASEESKKE